MNSIYTTKKNFSNATSSSSVPTTETAICKKHVIYMYILTYTTEKRIEKFPPKGVATVKVDKTK